MSFLTDLIAPVTALVGKFIPDKDQANRLAHELATMADKQHHGAMMAQVEVNKVEAAHPSLFVSGWRPYIGWVCGMAMTFNYLFVPIVGPIVAAYTEVDFKPLDLTTMMPILFGLLGLGGMRMAEKIKGVARK